MVIYAFLLTLAVGVWLVILIRFPHKWADLVDKENDFWIRRGVVKKSTSGWVRRLEKGRFLVVCVWALFILLLFLTTFLIVVGL